MKILGFNVISSVLGGVGLGSLLTSFVSHYLNMRIKKTERLYNEKREAYLGLLNAPMKAF